MPEFILNSAGTVHDVRAPSIEAVKRVDLDFHDLDSFTQGYIEAMFFTECEIGKNADSHEPETQSALHGECGFSDLAPEALAAIIAQCAAFQRDSAALLEEAFERDYDDTQAGRDFWFTRNGHGVGFWDRKELEPDSDEYEALTTELRAVCAAWSDPDDKAKSREWDSIQGKRSALKTESIGERLSAAAKAAGEVYVYLDDDGRVYHAGGSI